MGWRASPFQGRVVNTEFPLPDNYPLNTVSTQPSHLPSLYFPFEASPLAQDAVSLPGTLALLHIWRVISRRAPKQGLLSCFDLGLSPREEEGE